MNLYRISIKLRSVRKHLIGNYLADSAFGALVLATDHVTIDDDVIRITLSTIAEDIEGLDE